MTAKMKRLSLHLKSFLLLLWLSVHSGDGYSCPYGQHCVLEPAPPGRTPPCAQPGLTYCVHPDPYPEKIIRQLIEAGQYDISTLLSDESRDEFSQAKKNDYPYDYGPNSLPHVDQISLVNDPHYQKNYNTKFHTRYNHDIFSQKTPLQPPTASDPTPYNINAYQASNFSKFGFHGYSPNGYWNPNRNFGEFEKKVLRQTPLGYNQNYFGSNFYPGFDTNDWFRPSAGVTQYNPNEWWKYMSPSRSDVTIERSVTFPTRTSTERRRRRNAELVRAADKRKLTGAEALRIALGLANEDSSAERTRRQAQAPNQQTLCSVRTEFTTPRAALNNKGNWKYVVNMPDNMSQLVRAEICTSTECSGICTVPPGYTSRCEQKYIQKRLVALQSDGTNLYTDVFWIPSCCQCTFTANTN
ncbi:protein spaetzle 5 isoform X1 [Trichoplusia ni]|uniref:Protein spaetzle 5 isoform X1 n=1 Tax=Trichoplusia ni TaxID=7111 RepID=A0A7E5WGK0_TRINI|nr:protein spaetzle 5 isoform X1 [Trichoplusia ni]